MSKSSSRDLRRRILPTQLQGKPFRRLQRAFYQRRYAYPHRTLLVIGQPKSGTTWVTRMLCEPPGFVRWTPDSIKLDSHHLRPDDLTPPPAGYTVVKMHCPPTNENIRAIHHSDARYVLTFRDPRDLAVSWAYYVGLPGRTRWVHPEAVDLEIPERIDYYIANVLERMIDWAMGWRSRIDEQQGVYIRYEDLLAAPFDVMRGVYDHCGLPFDDAWLRAMVERHSFRAATGRRPGEGDAKSFNRKGIAGDWRNHFTDAQKRDFKTIAGEALIALSYEQDQDW